MKKVFVIFLAVVLAISMGIVGIGCPDPVDDNDVIPPASFTWSMSTVYPRGTLSFENMETFCEQVKDATDGQLVITPYGADELVPSGEQLDAVGAGLVEIAWDVLAYAGVPVGGLHFSMPGGITSLSDITHLYYDEGLNEIINEVVAEYNAYYLGPIIQPGQGILLREPIESLEDLDGRLIRSFGTGAKVMEKLGASVVFMPLAEVYSALSAGIIDGLNMSIADISDMAMYEVAEYFVIYPPFYPYQACDVFVNMDAWNELPDHLKTALSVEQRAYCTLETTSYTALEASALAALTDEYGMEVLTLPELEEARLREAAMEVWEEVAEESAAARAFVDLYTDKMQEWGYLP